MNKNAVYIAVASALLAGAIVFAVMRGGGSAPAGDGADAGRPRSGVAETGGSAEAGGPGPSRSSRARERGAQRSDSELIARYGEARTGMSRLIAGNIADLLSDAVEMGDMALGMQTGGIMGRAGMLNPLLRDLELTDEQREKAQALFMENQRRNLESIKSSVETLRESPEGVMSLILASDAHARGDISEEQYQRIREEAAGDVAGILNPLDRNNFRGGDPLGDELFVSGMREILDDEQDARLQERIDNRPASTQRDISALPSMELEQLDKAVGSGKKLTSGLKQMMEGMGALQEMAPLLEER